MLSAWQIVQQFSAAHSPSPSFTYKNWEHYHWQWQDLEVTKTQNSEPSTLAARIKNQVLCVATWRSDETEKQSDQNHRKCVALLGWLSTQRQSMRGRIEKGIAAEWREDSLFSVLLKWHKIGRTNFDYREEKRAGVSSHEMFSMNLFMLIGETNSVTILRNFSWFCCVEFLLRRQKKKKMRWTRIEQRQDERGIFWPLW